MCNGLVAMGDPFTISRGDKGAFMGGNMSSGKTLLDEGRGLLCACSPNQKVGVRGIKSP